MSNKIKIIYGCVSVFICLLFLKAIHSYIRASFLENDLLWYVPSVLRVSKDLSLWQALKYLFNPLPMWYAGVSLKTYIFSALSIFGPLAGYFISISVIFHFANAALVFFLSRHLGLDLRVGVFAALSYLTFFAHFHVYMWPMTFQHLIVVFFILLVINLYLYTDKLIDKGQDYSRPFMITVIANLAATFCRVSILILPALILTHILFCAKDQAERRKKYDIWLPLFAGYLLYPLITFAFGEPQFLTFLLKVNIPGFVKYLVLFSGGIAALFIFRLLLEKSPRYNLKGQLKWPLIAAAGILFLLLLKTGGLKRLLIPYNFLVPFVGTLGAFLHPVQNSLLIDSTRAYHYVPLQLNVFNFLLSLVLVIFFISRIAVRNRAFIILGVWYFIDIGYLYLRNPLVSRYFIYLSPLFCIIFASVMVYWYQNVISRIKFRPAVKEIILMLLILLLLIPNILAIKLALFKDKLVNNLLIYDYVRAAESIKDDLNQKGLLEQVRSKPVYLDNVCAIDTLTRGAFFRPDFKEENLNFVFARVFNDSGIRVKINEFPDEDGLYMAYSLDGARVNDADGADICAFSRLLEAAEKELRLRHYPEAEDLLKQALKKRPYLLNYLLSQFSIEDLEWITRGCDLHTWVERVVWCWGISSYPEKAGYISGIMHREIDDYIRCLFYLSYLKHIRAEPVRSRYCFSQIRFLEADYQALAGKLRRLPLVGSQRAMLDFLDGLNSSWLYVKADDYTNRFRLGKFLLRLINS